MEVLGQVDAVHDGREIKRASVYDIQPNDLSLDGSDSFFVAK